MAKPKTLKEALKGILTKKELSMLPKSFDIVGSLLIFSDFPDELKKKEKRVGETILSMFPNISTVLKKTGKYSGRFRTPRLRIIAGRRRKETEHRENNVRLVLNPETVYFSPRLSHERQRICSQVKDNESVLVMFSGCGPYPIEISRNTKAKEIYAIEINPAAHRYAEKNAEINKASNIKFFNGDVREVLPAIRKRFDRVIMPLPKTAEEFLELGISKTKPSGTIHFYDFRHEQDIGKTADKIKAKHKNARIIRTVKCGQFSPGVFRICVDFRK